MDHGGLWMQRGNGLMSHWPQQQTCGGRSRPPAFFLLCFFFFFFGFKYIVTRPNSSAAYNMETVQQEADQKFNRDPAGPDGLRAHQTAASEQ